MQDVLEARKHIEDSGPDGGIKVRLILKEKKDIKETEVEIRFQEMNSEVENLISAVKSAHDRLIGIKDNGDSVPVSFSQILYFEAVDRYVFAYTSASVYKVRNTLFELEEMCRTRSFVRISKAQIVNVNVVRKISPDEGRKLRLLLANGETVIVSRGYLVVGGGGCKGYLCVAGDCAVASLEDVAASFAGCDCERCLLAARAAWHDDGGGAGDSG